LIIFQVFQHNNNQEYIKNIKFDYKSKYILVIDIESLSKNFCNKFCFELFKSFVYIYYDFKYLFVNNNIGICERNNSFLYFVDN